jgi:hypothetical protein
MVLYQYSAPAGPRKMGVACRGHPRVWWSWSRGTDASETVEPPGPAAMSGYGSMAACTVQRAGIGLELKTVCGLA